MIKNKAILEMLEKKKQEVSCDNCKHCNLNAYHSGKWYCRKISVFKCSANIDECFERKQGSGCSPVLSDPVLSCSGTRHDPVQLQQGDRRNT